MLLGSKSFLWLIKESHFLIEHSGSLHRHLEYKVAYIIPVSACSIKIHNSYLESLKS